MTIRKKATVEDELWFDALPQDERERIIRLLPRLVELHHREI